MSEIACPPRSFILKNSGLMSDSSKMRLCEPRIRRESACLGGEGCVCVCVFELLSCVRLFATPWNVARQVPLSMGFSRQEHWSRLPFPLPGDISDPGIKRRCPALQADS